MIKIYNSLTNKLEEFKPIKENELSMYVCGSTVYNDMHIGNARPVVFFDVVSRFFQYVGYKVKFVSNFTDIDDKIIKKAEAEGVDESVISERYIKSILETYKLLNCQPHYKNPKVTETMDEIIKFVELLVEKNGAYVVDNDVYFDVSKDDEYGILSGQTVENLISGCRVEENDKKHSSCDFNLWKETTVGKKWDSPWGCGRPGWHTECVVMIDKIFNGMIDIHGGGSDLKFPHHENEIAQSKIAFDHNIANYWMHNGRIDFNGEKMSKSIGNIVDAKGLVKEIGYGPFRLLILSVPYRQPLNYREELLNQVKADYEKIYKAKLSLCRKLQLQKNIVAKENIEIKNDDVLKIKQEFIDALSSDFNTANALTAIIKTVKMINTLTRQKEFDEGLAVDLLTLLNEQMWVLGIDKEIAPLNEEQLKVVLSWQEARNNKNFELADKLRQEIVEKGIEL